MDDKPKKKVALVTGGSRGIGRAISMELSRYGCYVIANFRSDADGARQTVRMIKEAGADGV
jgi:NAD(P)-dependent dehydrogenase (short-subunit alcohol dehydrogenase family)